MQIIDTVTSITLARQAVMADTFLSRLKGLMFDRSFGTTDALILCPCNAVHTFCMRMNIDLIFADKNLVVLQQMRRILPGRVLHPVPDSYFVIELPDNTAYLAQDIRGHQLSFNQN